MCDSCGCGDPHLVSVDVHERVLLANDRRAQHNREHFDAAGVLAVNLMGSPGAGKTAVLEATAAEFKASRNLGAIAGDLATDHDAARLARSGIDSRSITTGNACHLDADMVHQALHQLPWRGFDILFVENVGNLVCPAVYDLGEHARVVALSVTEGEDKPLKYPVMFAKADLVLLTKLDLLPHLPGVSTDRIWEAVQRVMPAPRLVRFSAVTGEGVQEWIAWLEARRASLQAAEAGATTTAGRSRAGESR
jgi:hydrogenase nickel incorporation protein HypB